MKQTYKTRQRALLLALLREHPERCLSAMDIAEALRQSGEKVGESTVYRTLALLCSEGLAVRYTPAHAALGATYQYAPRQKECAHHLHLKCQKCGTLYHADCEQIEKLNEHILSEHGFSVNHADTILYGECDACRRKQK